MQLGLESRSPWGPSDGGLAASWVGRVDLHKVVDQVGTPVFIYSEEQLLRNIARIRAAARDAGLTN